MLGVGPNACVHLVAADSRAARALVGLDTIEKVLFFVIQLLFAIENASLINMCASLRKQWYKRRRLLEVE